MAHASIPVDLLNPGQVFACLGFLEAADLLLGDAEGGFDLREERNVQFALSAAGDQNPFAAVLEFLAKASVRLCVPAGHPVLHPEGTSREARDDGPVVSANWELSDYFPAPEPDRMALPIELRSDHYPPVRLGHWADGSSRNDMKLYAGNRSGYSIASSMIFGTRDKPRRNQGLGDVKSLGVSDLWRERRTELTAAPFDVLTPMGGSFNFDPRGGWTALDAGYSPNEHSDHWIEESPVVEILAACGLEHARPFEYQRRKVRYGAWGAMVPPILARPALGGVSVALALRRFRFTLALSGKNKIVTFAEEEYS